MCYATGSTLALHPSLSPIRALHSLTSDQVASVAAALQRLPASWSLDEQEGYDGDLTLILTPADPNSDLSLALWRSPAGFHLATMRDDEQVGNNVLASIENLLASVASSAAGVCHFA